MSILNQYSVETLATLRKLKNQDSIKTQTRIQGHKSRKGSAQHIIYSMNSSDDDDEIPKLVSANNEPVPVTIITGYLGEHNDNNTD